MSAVFTNIDLSRSTMHELERELERQEHKCEKCVNNLTELEKIKRQLHNLIDRVDALKSK